MIDPALFFAWPVSSRFGWGVRGLGGVLNYPGIALSLSAELDAELPPDDPRGELLAERVRQSRAVHAGILAKSGPQVQFEVEPVLVPLGNNLTPHPVAYGRMARGRPTIACPVFEDVAAVEANIERLRGYDRVVVASRWNQEVLADLGIAATLCHEGIDPAIFNPSVRTAALRKRRDSGDASRFRVFSGGKAEWRKGQDLVIQAFKVFAEKHDDAVLVAAWGSPFGHHAADFEGKWEYGAPPGAAIGMPNFGAWLQRAGLKPHQFEIVSPRPNWQMAEVYGSCGVALFPNRCEGGTNFVAMECAACGVPIVLNDTYGQADITDRASFVNCSNVEGIIECLRTAYVYDEAQEPTDREYWTWERHWRQIAEIVRDA